jgi:hypothetical protein
VNDHFTIAGIIRIEPRPNSREAAPHNDSPRHADSTPHDDSTLERLLLGLAVCETFEQIPRGMTPARSKAVRANRRGTRLLRADLSGLANELQSEWEALNAKPH